MEPASTTCPGCAVVLPSTGIASDPRHNNSHECWMVYGEVAGFELANLVELGRFHQLAVDTYGAQHSGLDPRGIRIAYSLVGLLLHFEESLSGLEIRDAHQKMGRPDAGWPAFKTPAGSWPITVLEVAERGARVESTEGHVLALRMWAAAVWALWEARHADVAALARDLRVSRHGERRQR